MISYLLKYKLGIIYKMVYVPKNVGDNRDALDEVQAFFSIVPVLGPDNDNYDFQKQVEKVLKKYANEHDDWASKQSMYNGKVVLRQMINNDELRWNKKRTGFKPTWKKFDLWRHQQIIKCSNLPDSEKEAMGQEMSCDLLQTDAKKLQEMTKKYKAEKKTNKDLREENAKLKAALSRLGTLDRIDAHEASVPLEFNMENNSIADYAKSAEPMKLYEATRDSAFQLAVDIFAIHKKGVGEKVDGICDEYEAWVEEEFRIMDNLCDSLVPEGTDPREQSKFWPEGFNELLGTEGAVVDVLREKLEEIKIDSE